MGMNVHSKVRNPTTAAQLMDAHEIHPLQIRGLGGIYAPIWRPKKKKRGFSYIKATYQESQRLFGVLEQAKACARSCSSYHPQDSVSVVSLPL